jgi:D-mannonate dehydratase
MTSVSRFGLTTAANAACVIKTSNGVPAVRRMLSHITGWGAPLPHFVETFPDDGYLDMYRVTRELRAVGFDGAMEPDHVPQVIGDKGIRPAGTAYCIACMRSYLRRANEEVG